MSASRSLCAVFAALILISSLWVSSAGLATPAMTSAIQLPSAEAQDDDDASEAAKAPPFKPVARVSSLMAGIGMAFGKVREALPQVEEEHRFRTIGTYSEVIAELSNVHTHYRRKPIYLEMAADTRSIALELARAAREDAPDEVMLETLVMKLDNSCSTCHEAQ